MFLTDVVSWLKFTSGGSLELLRAIPSDGGGNSCAGISSQHTCYYKRLQLKREEGWEGVWKKKKKRLFNLVQLSQFSQDKDPRDIYLIYKGARQGGRHVLKETFINFLSVDEGRRKKKQTSEKETLQGDSFWTGEGKGSLLALYAFTCD